ncbi:MAG: phosphate signaling complex protein PhoU [Chloroflexota bacterium]
MPREAFERNLRQLQDDLLALGTMVEQALVKSVDALKNRNLTEARRIIVADKYINEKRFKIEEEALRLIATQQPMAGDMRTIAGVLEIVTELERMGDYAKGIAKINVLIGDEEPFIKPLIDIPLMAEKARSMLRRGLDAFVNRDVEAAYQIPAQDDEVDQLYNQVYRELLALIMANPQNIDQATYLLWVAHNLERTADRVTNICERVVFTVTGEMKELEANGF